MISRVKLINIHSGTVFAKMLDVPYKRLEEAKTFNEDSRICERRNLKRLVMPFVCLLMVCVITWHTFPVFDLNYNMPPSQSQGKSLLLTRFKFNSYINVLCLDIPCLHRSVDTKNTTIFIITPTYKRPERLADMTR